MSKVTITNDQTLTLKRWLNIMTLIIILLASSTLFYRYRYVVVQDKINRYEVSYVLKKSKIGEVLDTKDFSFAVTKVIFDESGTKDFPAPPGVQFVMVSVSIHNKTTHIVNFYPIFEVTLKDEMGTVYEVSAAPNITEPSIAGEIEQGVATNGVLGFMVPTSVKVLELQYEPKAFPDANMAIYGIKG